MKLGQETNQIWTQEAGTHDTHNRTLTTLCSQIIGHMQFLPNNTEMINLQSVQ